MKGGKEEGGEGGEMWEGAGRWSGREELREIRRWRMRNGG